MVSPLVRAGVSNKTKLYLIYVAVVIWLTVVGWSLIWPVTWLTYVIVACYAYLVFRIVFEVTVNRRYLPTVASCYVSRQKIAEYLQKDFAAKASASYRVVDLGSGRGELVRAIARSLPQASVTGVERAFFPHMQASLLQKIIGPSNLHFVQGDIWTYDCSQIDVVVMYLGPSLMPRLGEKFRKEMKAGSLILSHNFPLKGDWIPDEVLEFRTPFKEEVFVYRVP